MIRSEQNFLYLRCPSSKMLEKIQRLVYDLRLELNESSRSFREENSHVDEQLAFDYVVILIVVSFLFGSFFSASSHSNSGKFSHLLAWREPVEFNKIYSTNQERNSKTSRWEELNIYLQSFGEGCAIKFPNNDSVRNEFESILRCYLNRSFLLLLLLLMLQPSECSAVFYYAFQANRTLQRFSFSLDGDENSRTVKCSRSEEARDWDVSLFSE